VKLERKNGTTKTLIYVPTLRDQGTYQLANALPDLAALSSALEAQNAELLLKLHPKMKLQERFAHKLPHNIRILPTELDIYPVLHDFDVLITDYSSLFFDYIFAKSAGVILYTPDFDEYTATERDLAWDYDDVTIGVRANDFRHLCDVIRNGQAFQPLEPAKLALLRERFWDGEAHRPTASQRIVDYLLEQQWRK
jgi:CDP-glycerol glycerophosphotransferase (TagB/SpsB family)